MQIRIFLKMMASDVYAFMTGVNESKMGQSSIDMPAI
jgi:hypothetical protein